MLSQILQVENEIFQAETGHFRTKSLKIVILHKYGDFYTVKPDIFSDEDKEKSTAKKAVLIIFIYYASSVIRPTIYFRIVSASSESGFPLPLKSIAFS